MNPNKSSATRFDENCRPNYPTDLPDMNEPPFRGSFNQLLAANLGRLASIEYMTGTTDTRVQTGIIENVSTKWVALVNPYNGTRMIGDVFAIRFITFLCD